MKAILSIRDNEGYTAEQVDGRFTLGDLLREVETAIDDLGEDTEVVTFNFNNPGGASWGKLNIDYGIESTDTFEAPTCMWD